MPQWDALVDEFQDEMYMCDDKLWENFGKTEVKRSLVPYIDAGKGVFATADVQKGQFLTEIAGHITEVNKDENLKSTTHDILLPNTFSSGKKVRLVIKGNKCKSGRGSSKLPFKCGQMLNDGMSTKRNNCRLVAVFWPIFKNRKYIYRSPNKNQRATPFRMFVVASRDIDKGEELLMDYGKNFWELRQKPVLSKDISEVGLA